MRASRIRSIVGLVTAAVVLGVFTLSPVAAHFTTNTRHLGKHAWQQFIKNKVYTKNQANNRFLPGRNVPAGTTIRGAYWMGGTAPGGFDLTTSEISFGHLFSAPPTRHFIAEGDPVPNGCSGSVGNPGANPGHLCVFELQAINAGARDVTGPGGDGTTFRVGTGLFIRSAAAGTYWSRGTWAATAGGSGAIMGSGGTGTIAGE